MYISLKTLTSGEKCTFTLGVGHCVGKIWLHMEGVRSFVIVSANKNTGVWMIRE